MAKKIEIETEVVTPEQAEEKRKGLRRLVEAMVRAIRMAWAWLTGGTFDDVRSDAARVKRVAGKAVSAGGVGLEAAGHALDAGHRIVNGAARAVGQTLGALLPHQGPGARELADAAVEADRYRAARDSAIATLTTAIDSGRQLSLADEPATIARLVREGAGHLAVRGREAGSQLVSHKVPSDVSVWLLGLYPEELRLVTSAAPDEIRDHLTGKRSIDGIRPFVCPVAENANPSNSVVSNVQFDAMVKAAQRGFSASRGEAEAASRRGVAHRVAEPVYEAEPALPMRRRAGPGRY